MAFQNIYYKRTAATAKACYMCFRPTTTVLATLNATDFVHTCDGHLTDRGFATLIEPPPNDTSTMAESKKVGDEEIRRIKEEWEERQKRAKEKEKAKAGEKDASKEKEKAKAGEKDASKDNDKDVGKDSDTKSSPALKAPLPPPSPIPVPGSSAAAKPTHQRYTLHRDVWSMRLAEHKKKRQTTVVKEVAPRLPMTPRGRVA